MDRIVLEEFNSNDFDRLISWVKNERDLVQFAGPIFQFPLDQQQLTQYLSDPKRRVFKIIHKPNSRVIGHMEAYLVSKDIIRLCRILIGEELDRGKGLAYEAISLIIELLKKNYNPKTIELNVYDFNINAIRCYEKIGFQKTAHFQLNKFNEEIWKSIKMELVLSKFKI